MTTGAEPSQSANFNRPPRIQFPSFENEEVSIPAPPPVQDPPEQNMLLAVLPVLGIGGMAVFFVFRPGANLFFVIPMVLVAASTIATAVLTQRSQRRDYERRRLENERRYLRLLEQKRARLQAAYDAQLAILEHNFPPPDFWLDLALWRDHRLWERRPADTDFTAFRVGLGRTPSLVTIKTPDPDTTSDSLDKAFALADEYRYLTNAPIVASLHNDASIGVSGKRAAMLRAVRAMICHLAVTHAPQDFHIHLIAPQAHYDDWRWLEWLPHTSQSHRAGAADLIALDTENIRNLMGNLSQVIDERRERGGESARVPHLLVIIDGPQLVESEAVYSTILKHGNLVGASALCLVSQFENIPADCGAVIEVLDDGAFRYARTGPDGYEVEGERLDGLSAQDSEHVARALAAVVMREVGSGGRIPRRVDFLDVYGLRYVEDLPDRLRGWWRRAIPKGELPYPVKIGRESLAVDTVIMLDEDHHGPHGMLAGTTGSGKSELLQTLICALVMEHDPRLLNLLLIDFKGGATFNVFNQLPHTVGTVTNLDSIRVTRALEALKAETTYRQKFLERKNVRDIIQYHKYYAPDAAALQDPNFEPLPHLFIIVDEFAQLAKEMPDFMRELVRTVQVGRSLGLHLILGTQSPMDVVTDEMNANLQFRICLRVQNIEASRAMLRRPDAAYLPAGWPGRGYFQVGEQGMFKQFQTAYVGAEYEPREMRVETEQKSALFLELLADGQAVDLMPKSANGAQAELGATALASEPEIREPFTVAKALCVTIADFARSQNVPWMPPLLLPPLPDSLTLGALDVKYQRGGWNAERRAWLPAGKDHAGVSIPVGSAPVGLLDDVYNRTQHPLWINLNAEVETNGRKDPNRKDGHAIVLGSPGTGKTTFLRTLAVSLALLHAPDQLHMYFVSFAGTGLDALGHLPHAEQVIRGTESERVRRLFGRLIHLLEARQTGRAELTPHVVVFIDQYEQFVDSYREQHLPDLERLVTEGRAANIFLVLTGNGPNTVPDRIRSLIPQRIALQLGQPQDYTLVVGRVSNVEDADFPDGRGFYNNNPPLSCQICLPVLGTAESEAEALETLVAEMRAAYLAAKQVGQVTRANQQAPRPIRELPAHITLAELLDGGQPARPSPVITALGRYDDDSLSAFELNWWEEGPHFIVTGPPGSGKTSLLHTAVLAAAHRYSPQDVRFLLVDFSGRSLRPLNGLKHVIRRITSDAELKVEMTNLRSELKAFYEAERANRAGEIPATVIVIDDYDLTSEALTTSNEVLLQLRDHVRLHSELGLHLWTAGYLERTTDPLMKQLLLRRSGFAFAHKESLQRLNVRTVGLPNEVMPEGRAYWPRQNRIEVVQIALADDPAALVEHINFLWQNYPEARWMHPASQERVIEETQSYLTRSQPTPASSAPAEGAGAVTVELDVKGLIEDILGKKGGK
jgi:S-DNA-T family DNA segregation ATPase FtsK/SpoIIIE